MTTRYHNEIYNNHVRNYQTGIKITLIGSATKNLDLWAFSIVYRHLRLRIHAYMELFQLVHQYLPVWLDCSPKDK